MAPRPESMWRSSSSTRAWRADTSRWCSASRAAPGWVSPFLTQDTSRRRASTVSGESARRTIHSPETSRTRERSAALSATSPGTFTPSSAADSRTVRCPSRSALNFSPNAWRHVLSASRACSTSSAVYFDAPGAGPATGRADVSGASQAHACASAARTCVSSAGTSPRAMRRTSSSSFGMPLTSGVFIAWSPPPAPSRRRGHEAAGRPPRCWGRRCPPTRPAGGPSSSTCAASGSARRSSPSSDWACHSP